MARNTTQPVEPGDQRERDQTGAPARRHRLGIGLVPAEQGAPQPRARERAGALVQVGHVERVRQQEVAVEAHERARVDRQREHPARRRQEEQRALQVAVVDQAPGERRPGRERELGRDAGGRDLQAAPAVGELPGLAGVGVEHRPQHDEGDAHLRHAQPVARGGERVAELVQHLREGERRQPADEPRRAELRPHRVREGVPLPQRERDPEHRRDHGRDREAAAAEPRHPGQHAREPRRRAHQRHPEEQVVVQQPLQGRLARRLGDPRQPLDVGRPVGTHQLACAQERDQRVELRRLGPQRRLVLDASEQRGDGQALAPARQQLELQPADAEEAVSGRIVDRPRGRAVGGRRRGCDPQVLAQGGQARGVDVGARVGARRRGGAQRGRPRDGGRAAGAHQPVHSRSAASGRRSIA
jgi:hypothetical protein